MKKHVKILSSIILLASLVQPVRANTIVSYIYNGSINSYTKESKTNVIASFCGDQIKHIPQISTGNYSKLNCGPACVVMLGTYYGKTITIQELNDFITPSPKGYSVADLEKMFTEYQIPYKLEILQVGGTKVLDEQSLAKYINQNYISLLAINTEYLRTQAELTDEPYRSIKAGRSYTGSFNHFVLCTGYMNINGKLCYQILDPLETDYTYIPASDLIKSMQANWTNCLLFTTKQK